MAKLEVGSLQRPIGTPTPSLQGFENRGIGDGRFSGRAVDAIDVQGFRRMSDFSAVSRAYARANDGMRDTFNLIGDVAMKRLVQLDEAEFIEHMNAEKERERIFRLEQDQRVGGAAIDDPNIKQDGLLRTAEKYYENRINDNVQFRTEAAQNKYLGWLGDHRLRGLEYAAGRQVREEKIYREQQFQGSVQLALNRIGTDPNSYLVESADLVGQYMDNNRDAPPEKQIADIGALMAGNQDAAVMSALANGNIGQAEEILGMSPYVEPVQGMAGIVSSSFGPRKRPLPGASANHKGVDLAVAVGTPIRAIADGVVEFVGNEGEKKGYGKYVVIRHGDKTTSLVGHLDGFQDGIKAGDKVAAGDVVAFSGNSGNSTGPHAHFEIKVDGRPVDPVKFFQSGRVTSLSPQRRIALQNAIDREKKVQMSAYQDSARALLADVDLHKAAIARDGTGLIDFDSRLQTLERAGAIKPEQAAALRFDVGISHDVYNSIQNNGFAGARAEIDSKYNPGEYQPGTMTRERACDEMAHAQALKMVDEEYARFMAQPLDYVGAATEREFSVMQKAGTIPEGREAVTKIEIGRRLAAEKGRLTPQQAELLPALSSGQINQLKSAAIQAQSPADKRAFYQEMEKTFGQKYIGQVLKDAGIGFGYVLNSAVALDNPVLGNILLQADGFDAKNLNVDADTKAKVKSSVSTLMEDTAYFSALTQMRGFRPGDVGLDAQYRGFTETLTNAALIMADANGISYEDALERIGDEFDTKYDIVSDDDLGFVVVDQGRDKAAFLAGLEAIKEAVGFAWDMNKDGAEWSVPTLFRNHRDGVVIDFPDGAGPSFTFDEIERIGGRTQLAVSPRGDNFETIFDEASAISRAQAALDSRGN